MVVFFLFGISGSGKSYYSNILKDIGYHVIHVSQYVKKYGIINTKNNCDNVVNDILNDIMNKHNVVIDGIRQVDIYKKVSNGLKHKNIFLHNKECFNNLLKRGLTHKEAYEKIKLDFELGICFFMDKSFIFDCNQKNDKQAFLKLIKMEEK
jgi:adenylate kinase family enzyme